MRRILTLTVLLTLSSLPSARAQVVGNPYLNTPGVISPPIVAQDQVIATGQPPIGAPTGGTAVQGGRGSLPGTGAGASMDAHGHLTTPDTAGCTGNCP